MPVQGCYQMSSICCITLIASLLALVACGQAAAPDPEWEIYPEIESVAIAPEDFALLPCGQAVADIPCALVIAGGKRVLIGAPAGVAATLSETDLVQLDAMLIFSLRAVDIEGVDEIRNASWRAGRDEPLLIVGPDGVEDFTAAINLAYERSDALTYIDKGARGGFDAAPIVAKTLKTHAAAGLETVVDTGDLRVAGTLVAPGRLAYIVHYDGNNLLIQACGQESAGDLYAVLGLVEGRRLDCSGDDLAWPLAKGPTFISRPAVSGKASPG